ncbi:MAG: hypothetical protein ACRELY_15535 [Polyangiaceae bacterium]
MIALLVNHHEHAQFGPLAYPYFFVTGCALLILLRATLERARAHANAEDPAYRRRRDRDRRGAPAGEKPPARRCAFAAARERRGDGAHPIDAAVPKPRGRRHEADEGLAVLRALGQDPAHAAVRLKLNSGFDNPTLRKIAGVSLTIVFWSSSIASARGLVIVTLGSIWLALFVVSGLSFLLPTYVTIGTDGVFVARRGTKRFLPFAKITEIRDDPEHADAVRS